MLVKWGLRFDYDFFGLVAVIRMGKRIVLWGCFHYELCWWLPVDMHVGGDDLALLRVPDTGRQAGTYTRRMHRQIHRQSDGSILCLFHCVSSGSWHPLTHPLSLSPSPSPPLSNRQMSKQLSLSSAMHPSILNGWQLTGVSHWVDALGYRMFVWCFFPWTF